MLHARLPVVTAGEPRALLSSVGTVMLLMAQGCHAVRGLVPCWWLWDLMGKRKGVRAKCATVE